MPRPADNLTWHPPAVTAEMRAALNGHRGATLWFTGLSGSGKSTIANAVAWQLHAMGVRTYVLDGDNVRQGLNKGLGFSEADRRENIRRIAEVARLFTDAGIINLTAFISPFRADRAAARAIQPASFLEVYIRAPLAVCEARDPKGLYRRARAGEIPDFTGIDSPYEEPEAPEIVVDTARHDIAGCADIVVAALRQRGIIPNR
jgi:adenylylsulfate kinase